MTSVEQADAWIGRTALDNSGRKIGRITRVWIDDYSGLPTWASLLTGCFYRSERIAPLSDVTATGGHLQLICTKAEVLGAPRVDDDGHLGLDDEWRLINHYKPAGTADPIRQAPAYQLPGAVPGMTTNTRWHPAGPGSASTGSAVEGQDRKAEQGALSERLFSPSMRRRLGLG